MHIAVFTSDEPDTTSALEQVATALRAETPDAPDFVALHGSALHDRTVLRGVASLWGGGSVHGGTSCLGVMSNNGAVEQDGFGMGAFAIWDPEGSYGTGFAELGADPVAAGQSAVTAALDAADRSGEVPDLIWLTTAPGQEERVISGIEQVTGTNVPIVGGSAADNAIAGDWFVFDQEHVSTGGVVVSVLFPSRKVASAYQSGYAPTARTGTVTRAEGRRLIEIDNRPAGEVYSDWSGMASPPSVQEGPRAILSDSTLSPLGRPISVVSDVPYHLLAHPATAHPDGSLELFADIAEGEEICLMTGSIETLADRAGRVASLATERGTIAAEDVAGALVIYCGGCRLAVRDHMERVTSGLDAALGRAPFLGVFTFGEQGPAIDGRNRHGNLMISSVVFGR